MYSNASGKSPHHVSVFSTYLTQNTFSFVWLTTINNTGRPQTKFSKEKCVESWHFFKALITRRLAISKTPYNYLVRTSRITRFNSTRQERREADKMAAKRKSGSRLSEELKRYKQNVRTTRAVYLNHVDLVVFKALMSLALPPL